MANLSVPAPGRIAVGYVNVNGQRMEVFLDPEWGRYFDSLNTQVVATSTTTGVAGPPGPAGAAGATGSTGAAGPQGVDGPALFMLAADGEPGDQGPKGDTGAAGAAGAPGANGADGAQGAALFLLTDTAESADFIPGPKGADGAAGATGAAGAAGTALFLLDTQDTPTEMIPTPQGTLQQVNVSGAILSSGLAGVGYTVGAGGSVTQATSKATAVTLNTPSGQITMNAASLAASTTVSFTLTNSVIAATDTLDIHRKNGGTALAYQVWVDSIAAGSAVIAVRNISAGALLEAVVLQFTVQKGSNT